MPEWIKVESQTSPPTRYADRRRVVRSDARHSPGSFPVLGILAQLLGPHSSQGRLGSGGKVLGSICPEAGYHFIRCGQLGTNHASPTWHGAACPPPLALPTPTACAQHRRLFSAPPLTSELLLREGRGNRTPAFPRGGPHPSFFCRCSCYLQLRVPAPPLCPMACYGSSLLRAAGNSLQLKELTCSLGFSLLPVQHRARRLRAVAGWGCNRASRMSDPPGMPCPTQHSHQLPAWLWSPEAVRSSSLYPTRDTGFSPASGPRLAELCPPWGFCICEVSKSCSEGSP